MSRKLFNFRTSGKPIFNIGIEICVNMSNARQDKNGNNFLDDVVNIALVIQYARKILVGPRHVTEKGYLVDGWKTDKIPKIEVVIDIMENLTQLLSFLRTKKKSVVISFHYKVNGGVGHITIDKKEGIIFNDAHKLEKEITALKKTYGEVDEVSKALINLKEFKKQNEKSIIINKEGCPTAEARRN